MRVSPAPLMRLIAAREGATAIEFAVIAPVLFLVTFATIEMSLIMLTQGLMESATYNASRLGKTGYVPGGTTREEAIREMIGQRAGELIDIDDIEISTRAYGSFSNISQPEPFTDSNGNGYFDPSEIYVDSNGNGSWDADMGAAGLGGAGDIVLYTITYPWQMMTPIMSDVIGNNGQMELSVRAVIKNEPF